MKENFTFEEQQLMSIYNPGTRLGLIHALVEMRTYLDKDEQELKDLTDSAITSLDTMTDEEFELMDLTLDLYSVDILKEKTAKKSQIAVENGKLRWYNIWAGV